MKKYIIQIATIAFCSIFLNGAQGVQAQTSRIISVEVEGTIAVQHTTPEYLIVAGEFSQLKIDGSQISAKPHFAIIDLKSKTLAPWSPQLDGVVTDVDSIGKYIFISGLFTKVNDVEQPYLAILNTTTQGLDAFQYQVDGPVNAVRQYQKSLILGGSFTQIETSARLNLGSIYLPRHAVTIWNPQADNAVSTLLIDKDILYVGGEFMRMSGEDRRYLASFYLPSGILSPWTPAIEQPVIGLSMRDGILVVTTQPQEETAEPAIAPIPPDTSEPPVTTSITTISAVGTSIQQDSDLMVDASALGFKIPTLSDLLTFAVRVFFVIAGLAAMFYMLLGALAWVTSGGDKDSVTAAREKSQAAVIGLIMMVAVLAVVWTMEQIIFKRRICIGLSCPLTLPGLLKVTGE